MEYDHPILVSTNGKKVETINDKSVPQVVENLAIAGKRSAATSSMDLNNHTRVTNDVLEAKRIDEREKRKKNRANPRKKKELLKNSSTLNDGILPSIIEASDQRSASAHMEELTKEVIEEKEMSSKKRIKRNEIKSEECSAASSSKDLEGNAQLYNNFETKEMKPTSGRKKKRKLTSDLSSPSTEIIQKNSAKDSYLEVSDQVTVSAHTNEMIGEVVSVNDPSFLIKQNRLYPVGEPAEDKEKEIMTANLERSVDDKSVTKEMKFKKRREKKRKLKGDSSAPSTENMHVNLAEGFSLGVLHQVPVSIYTNEMIEKVVSINDLSCIIKQNALCPVGETVANDKQKGIKSEIFETTINNNSKTKEIKSKKWGEKKRKLESDSNLPSTVDVHGNSAEGFLLEAPNQVPVSAHIKERMGEVVFVNDPSFLIREHILYPVGEIVTADKEKELETEILAKSIDINSEIKEMKSKKRREKKRKLKCDSSLPLTESVHENLAEGLEVSNQVPESAHTKELMGKVVSTNDPSFLIIKTNSHRVCDTAAGDKEKEIKTEILDIVDSNLETKEMKSTKTREGKRKRKLKSDSIFPSTEDHQESSAKGSSFEVSNQVPVPAHTKEMIREVVSVNDPSLLIKQNDSYPLGKPAKGDKDMDIETESLERSVDGNSEIKQMKSKKRGKKKRLKSDSSFPSTLDIQENSAKSSSLEVFCQVPVTAHKKEVMGEVLSIYDPLYIVKDGDSFAVDEPAGDKEIERNADILEKSVEEHGLYYDSSLKDISKSDLNRKPISQNGVSISSKLSETSDGGDVNTPEIAKEGPQRGPLGVHSVKSRRKLLVLDINGILTDIVNFAPKEYTPDMILSRKSVFKRPFCDDFLKFCFERFDVGIWSSRTMKNVKSAVDFLMGELQTKLLFCWDQSHCTDTGFTTLQNREKPMLLKDLKKLWEKHDPNLPWEKGEYNELNTLLVDDSPYKALRNSPYTAIFPVAYCYQNVNDNSLGPGGDLRVYLEELALTDNVQKYVEANPFGQRAITNKNASWNFYSKVIRDTSLPARKSLKFQSFSNVSGPRQTYY